MLYLKPSGVYFLALVLIFLCGTQETCAYYASTILLRYVPHPWLLFCFLLLILPVTPLVDCTLLKIVNFHAIYTKS
jgi:hypothetical protein